MGSMRLNLSAGEKAGVIDNTAAGKSTLEGLRMPEGLRQRGMDTNTETVEAPAPSAHSRAVHHDKGLVTIGAFKLLESVFFILVGLGALHLIGKDLEDEALKLMGKLRFDPEGRLSGWILDHVDAITAHRLRQIGIATFFYAALRVVEGVGLVLEKLWAEYLTVGATTVLLPWELYELARHPDYIRFVVLAVNLAVLAYLIWSLRERMKSKW
jgi:uncharacterized membrane protein (DUF2068 family)